MQRMDGEMGEERIRSRETEREERVVVIEARKEMEME